MHDRRVTIRIDQQTIGALEELSHESGESESALVRQAIGDLVKKRRSSTQSALALAAKAGLVGKLKGLPADLSTNRRHLQGFGE